MSDRDGREPQIDAAPQTSEPRVVAHDLVPATYRLRGAAGGLVADWQRLQRGKLVVLTVLLAVLCGSVEPTLTARPLLFWSVLLAWACLSNLADRAWLARHEDWLERQPSKGWHPAAPSPWRRRAAFLATVLIAFAAVLVAFGPGAGERLHPAVLWPLVLAALAGGVHQAGIAFGHSVTRDPACPDPVQPPR